LPAITQLLSQTLEHQPKKFCGLILEVVRRAIVYRARKNPIVATDLATLHQLVYAAGFRLKDLEDTESFGELAVAFKPPSARPHLQLSATDRTRLRERLDDLAQMTPTMRGLAFETFLNELFALSGLTPRAPFQIIGEQIDGSFEAESQTYLLEAKWEGKKTGQAELLVFSGKISGKAQWTRGLFVSFAGFTDVGLEAFARGKATNLVCMDRFDIFFVLAGTGSLPDVLARKLRRAAEDNTAFVSAKALYV